MNVQYHDLVVEYERMNARRKSGIKIGFAICGLLLRGSVQNLIDVLSLALWGKTFNSITTLINCVAIGLFIIGLEVLIRETSMFVFFSTFFCGMTWILSGLSHPENVKYLMESVMQFYIYVLPFMWIGFYLLKREMYLVSFLKICRIKLLLALITQLIIFAVPSADVFKNDYMDAANAMLVGLISVYYLMATEKKKYDVILSVAGTIVIMVSGSRGVFLSLVFFWIMYTIFNNGKRRYFLILVLGFCGAVFYIFNSQIIGFITDISRSAGFSTHLADALQTNSLFEDSRRTYLFSNFWEMILRKPGFGYGILGDRYLSLAFSAAAIYPHNIVLEVLVNFGFIIGGAFVIAFTALTVKMLVNKDVYINGTVIVLLCSCIVKLLVSSTFWNDQIFFMLVGTLIASLTIQKDVGVNCDEDHNGSGEVQLSDVRQTDE